MKSLLMRLVWSIAQKKQPKVKHQLPLLLHSFLMLCFASQPARHHRLPQNDRLKSTLNHIDHFPGTDLSNPVLARKAGMSTGAFIRLFSRHLRISPAVHVSRQRIRHAARLLAFTEKTMEEIAEESGFPNRHYLSRVFARQFKCGPAEYRRRHRVSLGGTPSSPAK
ncbi:MAG: helix-turn-helix domain-containing protein [Verrucomicrobiae bacterium]|nr:helix-turn-helix domain-containing protein [Verrucomicrobiae bacterium]